MNVEIPHPNIPPATPAATRLDRLAFVDALRGWAVLAVMTVHAKMWITPELPTWFNKLSAHGARGVQLFYVVSAFTLFLSVARRSAVESAPLRNFFIRRFFRIAPMFYVALILFLARDVWSANPGKHASLAEILATAFFVNGWNPHWINNVVLGQWSVAVEMMFYLSVPILAAYIKDIVDALWLFLTASIASAALYIILAPWNPAQDALLWQNFLFLWLPTQTPNFALGIILYFAWLKIDSGQIDRRLANCLLCASILLMVAALQGGFRFLTSTTLFSVAFVLFALGLAGNPISLFVNKITRSLGNVSYSFYLTHGLVIPLAAAVLNRAYRLSEAPALAQYALLWFLGGLATFVVSSISFRLIEKPGMALGKRLIQKLEAQ
jgi:peptidoglycan/LPS O-acetylase OafA/YrhL